MSAMLRVFYIFVEWQKWFWAFWEALEKMFIEIEGQREGLRSKCFLTFAVWCVDAWDLIAEDLGSTQEMVGGWDEVGSVGKHQFSSFVQQISQNVVA